MPAIKSEGGFTLIEVLVAMVIFLLALMPLCRLQYAAIQNSSYAYQLTRATYLAEQKMAELFTGSYDSLTTGAITAESIGCYTINWSRSIDTPIAGTATVTVTVTWNDSPNRPHTITLCSLRGK